MMSRTADSASSRSCMNAPVSGLSAGIWVSASQRPLTCRNRSSWTRTESSNVEKSIAGGGVVSVTAPMLPSGSDARGGFGG